MSIFEEYGTCYEIDVESKNVHMYVGCVYDTLKQEK